MICKRAMGVYSNRWQDVICHGGCNTTTRGSVTVTGIGSASGDVGEKREYGQGVR